MLNLEVSLHNFFLRVNLWRMHSPERRSQKSHLQLFCIVNLEVNLLIFFLDSQLTENAFLERLFL